MELEQEHSYLSFFRNKLQNEKVLPEEAWEDMKKAVRFQEVKKGTLILRMGTLAKDIHFICKGIFRTYFTDENGKIYNKNLFLEGQFPASKSSLISKQSSLFSIEALEDSTLISFSFDRYKSLMDKHPAIKDNYIAYLEKNWVILKEKNEIALVMQTATERYLHFLDINPGIENRISQLHIAAHLGITPTQLSRIRKNLK